MASAWAPRRRRVAGSPPCQSPFPVHASSSSKKKSQGQKGHFTVLLSPRKPEMNILLGGVSSGKFTKNQSVLQQIGLFWVSSSKGYSLSVSSSQFSLLFNNQFVVPYNT